MAETKEYLEFPLEYEGDPIFGVNYFITIYSGSRKMRFNLDSGAESNLISNPCLRGCSYVNCKTTLESKGVLGSIKTRLVLLTFSLDEFEKSAEDERFELVFSVVNKKDSDMFSKGSYDGLLGSTFLQFCEVNFRDAYIRVYKDPRGGKVFDDLMAKLYDLMAAAEENGKI